MNRFVKKIMEFLLKRTEHLEKGIDRNADPNDPTQKRIRAMLERRERMKAAISQSPNQKAGSKTSFSNTVTQCLEAKNKAMNPPKDSRKVKKNNRSGRRR
jgi:hypothetical protein